MIDKLVRNTNVLEQRNRIIRESKHIAFSFFPLTQKSIISTITSSILFKPLKKMKEFGSCRQCNPATQRPKYIYNI